MAYQMDYGNFAASWEPTAKKKTFSKRTVAIVCVIVFLLSLLLIPAVRDRLIPGDAQVTKEAAGEMLQRIRDGEGVVDAFAQFCLEIIENS